MTELSPAATATFDPTIEAVGVAENVSRSVAGGPASLRARR